VKLHEVAVRHRERRGDFVLLRYRWNGPTPDPGRFVAVRAAGAGLDPFLPRPFFVHDFEGDTLSLLFAVRGRGTDLISRSERLLVSDPLGRGFDLGVGGRVALVGGGVWTAPLRLLSRRLHERGTPHETYVEVSEDAPPAYAALVAERLPGATFVRTGAVGGNPNALLGRLGNLSRYEQVYVSGTEGTLRAAWESCAGRIGAQLAVRERMACADGSCHGCAVPVWREGARTYARACIEGPVFRAGELAW